MADAGKEVESLDALRKAGESAYFTDKGSMWVKLVIADARHRANGVAGGAIGGSIDY